jgi:hypothetical protein
MPIFSPRFVNSMLYYFYTLKQTDLVLARNLGLSLTPASMPYCTDLSLDKLKCKLPIYA